MKHILYPTDFSELSAKKLTTVKNLIKQSHAMLHLLHAYQLPLVDPYAPPSMIDSVLDSLKQKAEKQMADFVQQNHLENVVTSTECGTIIESIESYSQGANIDLVIMATEGPDEWIEKLAGTITKRIVSNMKIPVLVLPAQSAEPDFSLITYACDLEHDEIKAMEQIKLFAAIFDSTVQCLHIKRHEDMNVYDDNAIIAKIKQSFGDIHWEFVRARHNHATQDLLDWQIAHPSGIMALTARKKGFLEILFEPSTSRGMVLKSTMPLLILHE